MATFYIHGGRRFGATDRAVVEALRHAGFDIALLLDLDAYRLRHRSTGVSVDIPAIELYVQPAADTTQGFIAGLIRLAHRALMHHAATSTAVERVQHDLVPPDDAQS